MLHSYWACSLDPGSHNYWAHVPQLLKPPHPGACAVQQEKPSRWEAPVPQLESSPHLLQLEKGPRSSEDPAQSKTINNYIYIYIHLPMQGTQVRSLVREQRSHMSWGNKAHELRLEKSLNAAMQTQHSRNLGKNMIRRESHHISQKTSKRVQTEPTKNVCINLLSFIHFPPNLATASWSLSSKHL